MWDVLSVFEVPGIYCISYEGEVNQMVGAYNCLIFVQIEKLKWLGWGIMVFNVTFNHMQLYYRAVSFIGGGNGSTWRNQLTSHKSLTNFITSCCIKHTSPWAGFKLTILVMIGTDCTASCKFNYHTIMTTTAPVSLGGSLWGKIFLPNTLYPLLSCGNINFYPLPNPSATFLPTWFIAWQILVMNIDNILLTWH